MSAAPAATVLWCPACRVPLQAEQACERCGFRCIRDGGILDFLLPAERDSDFRKVNAFYEANPFPGYAPGDNAATLLDRSRRSPFLVALDQAIGPAERVVDCGCGTGQLAAFLALAGPRRSVYGVDACRASLRLADGFRERAGAANLTLLRGDLFALPVAEGVFDVVISRGVVHHTPEPWRAIECVARRVRPGGVLVLGFYESAGRAFHHFRQRLYRSFRGPVRRLDPILRRRDLGDEKKRTWVADQYEHPLEASLPFPRVWRQLRAAGFEWLRSVPPAPLDEPMFSATDEPGGLRLAARRAGWAFAGLRDEDAGMACVVARRPD